MRQPPDMPEAPRREPHDPDDYPAKEVMTSVRQATRPRTAPTCRVSLLIPGGRRRWWHFLATCPVCREPHMGRSKELAGVTGVRRLPCLHWVVIVVARTYGSSGAA